MSIEHQDLETVQDFLDYIKDYRIDPSTKLIASEGPAVCTSKTFGMKRVINVFSPIMDEEQAELLETLEKEAEIDAQTIHKLHTKLEALTATDQNHEIQMTQT
jgi:hypothetical protein